MKSGSDGRGAVGNNYERGEYKTTPPSLSTGWEGVYFALSCGATVDHGGQDNE